MVLSCSADVDTQVNIRANASTKSEIVGYLPKGASADLIEKAEKWSHIISNGVEGYIKNDYLAYGEDAEYLAKVVREKMGVENILINNIGTVIGSHTGPGVLAVFHMGGKR